MKRLIVNLCVFSILSFCLFGKEILIEYPGLEKRYILKKKIEPIGYGRIRYVPYSVQPAPQKVYSCLNSDILYQKEAELVIKRGGKKIIAYSASDPEKVYPIIVRTVLVKNKWGQPLFFTGMDKEGRIWKRKVGEQKKWYVCDSCGHGYSRLINAGHDLWICEDCYFSKNYSGEYRDRWLSIFGIWPNEKKDKLYYKELGP